MRVLIIFLIINLYAVFPCMGEEPGSKGEKGQNVNIVLLTVNVLRVDHVSAYGYARNTTPTIDTVADDSLVFTNGFAQAGYTLANVISIMTSLYPESHQVLDAYKDELSPEIHTLAEILQKNGYETGWFAPKHEAHLDLDIGFGRGFSHISDIDLQLRGSEKIPEWIKAQKGKKFFLFFNARHTHTPYLPLAKYRNKFSAGRRGEIPDTLESFDRGFYKFFIAKILREQDSPAAIFNREVVEQNPDVFNGEFMPWKLGKFEEMLSLEERYKVGQQEVKYYNSLIDGSRKENLDYLISLYDDCILGTDQVALQPIIETLRREKLYDDTLIIITADHGESHGEHKVYGHGMHYFDQLVHVPMIIKLPGQHKRRRIDIPAMSIDLLPTITDVAGVEALYQAQGTSLLKLIQDNDISRVVYGENREFAYMRTLQWKLILNRQRVRDDGPEGQLFDLVNDPDENSDAKYRFPERYQTMRKALMAHLSEAPRYNNGVYEFPQNLDAQTKERIRKTGYW